VNSAPIVTDSFNGNQTAVVGVPYDFDPTRNRNLFRDPDGDSLAYQVTLSAAPAGLAISGLRITGVPTTTGVVDVTVRASDGRGGSISEQFLLSVMDNQPPVVARTNAQVAVSSAVDYDATQAGTTFRDPENQPLTYQVSILSAPPGFSVQGNRIVGSFSAPGHLQGKIEARDPLGNIGQESFVLVLPSPISSRPTLPAQSFVYEDKLLPLTKVFVVAGDGSIDWDDTLPPDNPITNAGATLGRVLFYDKRLSITNTQSCASCHEQAHGFASPERFPLGALGTPTRRSPMALTNVRFNNNDRYFSDQRSPRLESLVAMPIEDPDELGTTMAATVAKLSAVDYYPPLFEAAFGTPQVTGQRISFALAQFLRTLITYQSRFDEAFFTGVQGVQPDLSAVLTAEEIRGFDIFTESQCGHCHMPRTFVSPWPANNGLDEVVTDPGEFAGRFRAASLRNIAVSAPYMHDGRFETLREVIDHYSEGVKMSPGLDAGLGGGRAEPFLRNFSDADKDALEAFLHILTDEAFLADPKFSDPFQ
jgi:cytochrome c peroxidase